MVTTKERQKMFFFLQILFSRNLSAPITTTPSNFVKATKQN